MVRLAGPRWGRRFRGPRGYRLAASGVGRRRRLVCRPRCWLWRRRLRGFRVLRGRRCLLWRWCCLRRGRRCLRWCGRVLHRRRCLHWRRRVLHRWWRRCLCLHLRGFLSRGVRRSRRRVGCHRRRWCRPRRSPEQRRRKCHHHGGHSSDLANRRQRLHDHADHGNVPSRNAKPAMSRAPPPDRQLDGFLVSRIRCRCLLRAIESTLMMVERNRCWAPVESLAEIQIFPPGFHVRRGRCHRVATCCRSSGSHPRVAFAGNLAVSGRDIPHAALS